MSFKPITSPLTIEYEEIPKNTRYVVGIDEAGRGALAGPLAIGYAVINLCLNTELAEVQRRNIEANMLGVYDSKKISRAKREKAFQKIAANCLVAGSHQSSAYLINQYGLVEVQIRALRYIYEKLFAAIHMFDEHVAWNQIAVLLDNGLKKYVPDVGAAYVKEYKSGETKSLSIASASVMAKVNRDRLMEHLPEKYSYWSFDKHKGYGTPLHKQELEEHGVCDLHRQQFAPIAALLRNR